MAFEFTKSSHDIFVSPVLIVDLAGKSTDEMMRSMLEDISNLRKSDPGVYKSNSHRVDSWHSSDSLAARPSFQPLVQIARDLSVNAFKSWGMNGTPRVTSVWSIITPHGGNNMPHVHPHADAVGVFYVKTSPDCGGLAVMDPRGEMRRHLTAFAGNEAGRRYGYRDFVVDPKDARLVLMPGWLMHYTEFNLSDEERVVAAFNVMARRD